MNLATRILGAAIFVGLFALATVGAFQLFEIDPGFELPGSTSVELGEPTFGLGGAPGETPNLLAGQQTPVAVEINNTGDRDVNITLASGTEGFDFETRSGVISLDAGNTTTENGRLTPAVDLEGDYSVTLVAHENGTDDELDSVDFNVTVSVPTPPEVSLSTSLPSARAGDQAVFTAELENTVDARQIVNVTLLDGSGNVEPPQVNLQPDGTGTAIVTVDVPADASGDYLVEIEATNEAGRSNTATSSVSVVQEGEIAVDALTSSFTVQPTNRYTVPIVIVSNADQAGEITASGEQVQATNFTSLSSRGSAGGFVTLEVAEDAPSSVEHVIDLQIAGTEDTVTTSVSTDVSGSTPTEEEQAEVEFTGRLQDGSLFDTSSAGITEGPFEKSEHFDEGQPSEPMTVRFGPRQQTPPGVVSAVRNMTEGESITLTLAPEDAFGPERRTQEMEATTEFDRHQEVERLLPDIPKNQLPPEFDIENREEGEIIEFETEVSENETIVLRFRVEEMGEQTVTLKRMAEEGETVTFYPPWPDATEVTNVNDTHITYTTTPPEETRGEAFTWDAQPNSHQAKWGEVTTVQTVNETSIVLRHDPEEGFEYQASAGRFGAERSFRVENVSAETIVVSTPNENPLGGEVVTFDLTVTAISEAQQGGLPPGFGE